jgi:hypothetical protein
MALRPCSACEQRVDGKLSSCYWSWNLADRSRVAWLQRLCVTCFCASVLALMEKPDLNGPILCPMCHAPSSDDMDPVFCKVYVPGAPGQLLELATCPRCAVELRGRAQTGAERLPDRSEEFGGQAPKLSAADVWASLGLRP